MSLLDRLNERSAGTLPGLLGMEVTDIAEGSLRTRMELRPELLAPNGYLHAATIVALADTSCGYGTFANLPEGAESFTTVELKSNFLGTQREGSIECAARLAQEMAEQTEQMARQDGSAVNGNGSGDLPISNYDDLSVNEASQKLGGPSEEQLQKVRAYEKQNKNRDTLVNQIDRKTKSA